MFRNVLQQRTENLQTLRNTGDIGDIGDINATKNPTKLKGLKGLNAQSTLFVKIMQDIQANYFDGQWKQISTKVLREALEALKNDFDEVPTQDLKDAGNFLFSLLHAKPETIVLENKKTRNKNTLSSIVDFTSTQINGICRSLCAIIIVLGNQDLRSEDIKFVLNNTDSSKANENLVSTLMEENNVQFDLHDCSQCLQDMIYKQLQEEQSKFNLTKAVSGPTTVNSKLISDANKAIQLTTQNTNSVDEIKEDSLVDLLRDISNFPHRNVKLDWHGVETSHSAIVDEIVKRL